MANSAIAVTSAKRRIQTRSSLRNISSAAEPTSGRNVITVSRCVFGTLPYHSQQGP